MSQPDHKPSGNFPAPATLHHLDLQAIAVRLAEGLARQGRRAETLARESGVSVVLMAMAEGNVVKEHSAPGVVTIQALRGHVSVTSGGQATELGPGHLLLFQPGVRHDVRALEASTLLLTITGAD
jgi:quercetin dioxygenase-like cupin family protein